MRDLLGDLEAGSHLSDPNPVKRAQNQMKAQAAKRFYDKVSVARGADGFVVLLDGKPVRTPGKAVLSLPTEQAAAIVAAEFDAQQDKIDPVTMPATRLVNTAIDGVAADTQAVIEDILRYASSDLLCYRADAPEALVERQADAWDPVIDWARAHLGARFVLAEGIVHVTQPREAIGAIGIHLARRAEPLRLAALHLMTTLTGSALLALAVEEGELDAEAAWAAAHVDEDWNAEQWGEDYEAAARRKARAYDFSAAVRVLSTIR
mgnify:CR=1 FL=1